MYQALVESLSHLQAGRYVRARKSALLLLKLSDELRTEHADVPQDATLRAIAHMLAADSAHALRDVEARNDHYEQAITDVPLNGTQQQQEVREGAQMRAARWALDDRDPQEALQRLEQLPPVPAAAPWPCAFSSRPAAWPTQRNRRWTLPGSWPNTVACRKRLPPALPAA